MSNKTTDSNDYYNFYCGNRIQSYVNNCQFWFSFFFFEFPILDFCYKLEIP